MDEFAHGFRIDQEKCEGCLSCMRACPTHAIRVRHRKARYKPERCIDCGECLSACPSHAISATTWSVEDIGRFRFKVAVPCPVLFGQFPRGITPAVIVNGLLTLGFDAVWDYSVDVSLAARAVQRYVEAWKGPKPLISVACPVVVRLVQVSYPRMVNQLIPIQVPREIAGREAKRQYSKRLGLRESEIAAIYITPCQAKAISILQPAEHAVSHLDGTLGITDVYNGILASAARHTREGGGHDAPSIRNSTFLRWHVSEGLGHRLAAHQHLRLTGLANIIQVFDDIERGKLRNIDFIEPYTCWTGCAGGNLTVANIYVTRSTVHGLVSHLPRMDAETQAEVDRRYQHEDFQLEHRVRPRPLEERRGSLKDRVQTLKLRESTVALLPGLNCGLCGAPTCKELARDISLGDATKQDCVFLSKDRLRELQRVYLRRTP